MSDMSSGNCPAAVMRAQAAILVFVLLSTKIDDVFLLNLKNSDTVNSDTGNVQTQKGHSKDSVEVPLQPFVNAPPAGPMETLSIDIKGASATYKNFSKPSKVSDNEELKPSKVLSRSLERSSNVGGLVYLRNAITGGEEVNGTNAKTYDNGEEDLSGESGDVDSVKPLNGNASTEQKLKHKKKRNKKRKKKKRRKKKIMKESAQAVSTAGGADPAANSSANIGAVPSTLGASTSHPKRKKKHGHNKYKVYSGTLNNTMDTNNLAANTSTTNSSSSSLPQWAKNLANWSKKLKNEKNSMVKVEFEGSKGENKNTPKKDVKPLTLGMEGKGGSQQLPSLTTPVATTPLVDDSGDVSATQEKPPPLLIDDEDEDEEPELPKQETLKGAPTPSGVLVDDGPPLNKPLSPEHDPLKSTHPGDEGIQHDTDQESLKDGKEQGPLPPGHEQGPKLPGHEKGPVLPGQVHASNYSTHEDGADEGPSVIDEMMAGGHCTPCLGQHGVGVPVAFDQDGTLHCEPCHGAQRLGAEETSAPTLKEKYIQDKLASLNSPVLGATTHPSDHEPFQPLLPTEQSVDHSPSQNEFPFGRLPRPLAALNEEPSDFPLLPPVINSITHDEFEKIGQHVNPELLDVIEKDNHKISALWNEVKDVESRLGNIESVVEVVERALQRIESKLNLDDETHRGVFVDDPVHQKTLKIKQPSDVGHPGGLPLYPPNIGEYHDSHVTEGFPHSSHHSPVLKQYFIPLQSNVGEAIKDVNNNANGLPVSVNKFLAFLMQQLQKDKTATMNPAELAMQLQNAPAAIPARVPHVPLPQPDLPYPPTEHDIDRLEYEIGRLPKQKFAPKLLHPELEDSVMCPCENGGQCISGRSDCDCPIRYTGIRCEKPVPRSPLLESIINDLPTETQRQLRGGSRSGGMITLPLMIANKEVHESPESKGELSEARILSLLSHFVSPEYLQKFAKRQKVTMKRRYVKYPVEKQKK